MVETDTGEAVVTEDVRYGLRVSLVAMAAPPLLTTKEGLEVSGHGAFRELPENVHYVPMGTYKVQAPVGPL